jgi:hypothetical protein
VTSDDAWVAINGAWGRCGAFGYGFTADDRHVVMSCLACGGEECVALQGATAILIVASVRAFEERHLSLCAERITAARTRLNAMAEGAPVATTPDEARHLMAKASNGHWPVGSASKKGEA